MNFSLRIFSNIFDRLDRLIRIRTQCRVGWLFWFSLSNVREVASASGGASAEATKEVEVVDIKALLAMGSY